MQTITVQVPLTPELATFIESRIASGRFNSPGQALGEGLRLLAERESVQPSTLDDIRRRMLLGLARQRDTAEAEGFSEVEDRL
jgi:putative addiction module CopG family antidote